MAIAGFCLTGDASSLWTTPSAASRISPGQKISGSYFAAETVVNSHSYTRAGDPGVFTNLLEFAPDRWQHPMPDMKARNTPASIGAGNCIGMHLASSAGELDDLCLVAALRSRARPQHYPRFNEAE
jgi:hypothetical protein